MLDRCSRRLWRHSLALLGVLLTAPVFAATEWIETSITRTMTTSDERFGGCAVGLAVSPSESGNLDCPANKWVTFSCVGEHTSKSNALRMFDSAQMAFALGKKVVIYVDDSKKHNMQCFAYRIDVLQADVATSSTEPIDSTE